MNEWVKTVARAEELPVGTIVRGVTNSRSYYTLQVNEDGGWDQMGNDDRWGHADLFPFFDYLHIIYRPLKGAGNE